MGIRRRVQGSGKPRRQVALVGSRRGEPPALAGGVDEERQSRGVGVRGSGHGRSMRVICAYVNVLSSWLDVDHLDVARQLGDDLGE